MANILVVDDDAAICMLLETGLVHHEVRSAGSGSEAIAMTAAFAPDVVVTDLSLRSEPTGAAVARILTDRFPQAKIVILSGYPSQWVAEQVGPGLTFSYLSKPCSLKLVVDTITTLLR